MSRSGAGAGGGFTLIELVVVILVTGIIAGVIGLFIAEPIRAYLDQARRGALVDAAQLALVRMGRDLRSALPNSVRVNASGGTAIEMLHVIDGDRYRAEAPGSDLDQLVTATADDSFDTFMQLGAGQVFSNPYLAVYPQPGASPYTTHSMTSGTAVTISGTVTVGGATEYRVGMSPSFKFLGDSPSRRVFLVEGPVSYYCTGNQLLRYADYGVLASQPVPPASTPDVIVGNVESCAFTYQSGATQRRALATLTLVLAASGERIHLVRQVHVDNTP